MGIGQTAYRPIILGLTCLACAGGEAGTSQDTTGNGRAWPNEPAGFQVLSDQPFEALTALDWRMVWNDSGYAAAALDSTAPFSPPAVAEFRYPVGFVGGAAPGTGERDLPGVTRLYVGLWWKPSEPWQGHQSNGNKIQYVFTGSHGSMFMAMYGPPDGPYELRVFPQFSTSSDVWLIPNVRNVPVVLGRWHRVEWLMVYGDNAESPNGICRWWLDGELIGEYFDVAYPPAPLTVFKLAPVWGGVEGVKAQSDYFRFDHVRLSGG